MSHMFSAPSPPPPPPLPPTPEAPKPNGPEAAAARKKNLMQQGMRSGRQSTILSSGGSDYSGNQLGSN